MYPDRYSCIITSRSLALRAGVASSRYFNEIARTKFSSRKFCNESTSPMPGMVLATSYKGKPGTCGDRSDWIHAVVCEPDGRTRNRMCGGSSGRDSSGRTTKAKTGSAGCGLASVTPGRRGLSEDLVTHERKVRSLSLSSAPTPVGVPAGQNTKCTTGHCPGQWSPTRLFSVDTSRPTRDRVFAVVATCRL